MYIDQQDTKSTQAQSESGMSATQLNLNNNNNNTSRKFGLGYLPIVALIFFEVCGGPFGIEDSVRNGGAILCLLSLIILPLVWSVPEALVTAELCSIFPENSGYAQWVASIFGPFWGFQEGFWSWWSGVIDNSVYPIFLIRYLQWFFPTLAHPIHTKIFYAVSSLVMTYLNYRGLQVVGHTAVFLMIFILIPFFVLALFSMPQINPSNWLQYDIDHIKSNFWEFINVMFWNLNYWDSISTLAGEMKDTKSMLPKALFTAVILVFITYFMPVLIGIGVAKAIDWQEGFFAYLSKTVSGTWLQVWIVMAAIGSQAGLFIAEMSSDSYQIAGMSDTGMLPKLLAHRSKHHTPTFGILLSSTGIIIMLFTFDFMSVVELLNYMYCMAALLEFSAFIYLRFKAPDYPRPYRVPLSNFGVIIMLLPAMSLLVVLILLPWIKLEVKMIIFVSCVVISGVLIYHLLRYCQKKKVFEFNEFKFGKRIDWASIQRNIKYSSDQSYQFDKAEDSDASFAL